MLAIGIVTREGGDPQGLRERSEWSLVERGQRIIDQLNRRLYLERFLSR